MQIIDSKDHKIINYLINNSRTSYTSIANTEQIPLSVVKYRVERLKENGIIIRFNTLIDYTKLGYSILRFHFILQYVSPEIEKKIIEHFYNYDPTLSIYNTKGKYDLVVTILEKNAFEFFSFYEKTLKKYNRYFREIYISKLFEIYVNEKSKLHTTKKKNNSKSRRDKTDIKLKIDPLDYKILDLLSEDSRISSLEIAERLNVSTTTIIRHINQLICMDVILNYSIITDSKKLGYKKFIIYFHLVNYNKKMEIIKYLSSISSIREIYCTFGNWNIELILLTPNFEHFIALMEKIKNRYIEDIMHYNYVFIEDTYSK